MLLRPFALLVLLSCAACDHAPAPAPAAPATASPLAAADELIRAKKWSEAATALEALKGEPGVSVDATLRLAEVYKRMGNVARAIVRLNEALAADPSVAAYYLPLAQLHLGLDNLEEARAVLVRGRAQGADDAPVAIAMGSILGRLARFDEARAEFERAGELGAEQRLVRFNLALLLTQTGKSAEALSIFEDLAAKHPEWASARRELGRLLVAKDPSDRASVERGLDLLWNCKEELKDDWRLYESMGDGWLALGDYTASIDAYTEALKLGRNPKSVEDRYRVAKQKEMAAKAAAPAEPPR